jgi:hypothetical protein
MPAVLQLNHALRNAFPVGLEGLAHLDIVVFGLAAQAKASA